MRNMSDVEIVGEKIVRPFRINPFTQIKNINSAQYANQEPAFTNHKNVSEVNLSRSFNSINDFFTVIGKSDNLKKSRKTSTDTYRNFNSSINHNNQTKSSATVVQFDKNQIENKDDYTSYVSSQPVNKLIPTKLAEYIRIATKSADNTPEAPNLKASGNIVNKQPQFNEPSVQSYSRSGESNLILLKSPQQSTHGNNFRSGSSANGPSISKYPLNATSNTIPSRQLEKQKSNTSRGRQESVNELRPTQNVEDIVRNVTAAEFWNNSTISSGIQKATSLHKGCGSKKCVISNEQSPNKICRKLNKADIFENVNSLSTLSDSNLLSKELQDNEKDYSAIGGFSGLNGVTISLNNGKTNLGNDNKCDAKDKIGAKRAAYINMPKKPNTSKFNITKPKRITKKTKITKTRIRDNKHQNSKTHSKLPNIVNLGDLIRTAPPEGDLFIRVPRSMIKETEKLNKCTDKSVENKSGFSGVSSNKFQLGSAPVSPKSKMNNNKELKGNHFLQNQSEIKCYDPLLSVNQNRVSERQVKASSSSECLSVVDELITPNFSCKKTISHLSPIIQDEIGQPKIKYSQNISASPNKYFGSPSKRKTDSPKQSTPKSKAKFSPFTKSNRSKSSAVSPFNQITQYYSVLKGRKKLFDNDEKTCSNVIGKQINGSTTSNNNVGVRNSPSCSNINNLQSFSIPSCSNGSTVINNKIMNKNCKENNEDSLLEPFLGNSIENTINKVVSDQNNHKEMSKIYDEMLSSQDFQKILEAVEEDFSSKGVSLSKVFNSISKEMPITNSNNSQKNVNFQKTEGSYNYKVFCLIIDSVTNNINISNETYLISQIDNNLKNVFLKLPLTASHLYSKLLTRKHSWIRKSDMKYPGISKNLDIEIDVLSSCGFLVTDLSSEDTLVLLNLLQVPELKQLCKVFKIPIVGQKAALIETLINICTKQQSVSSSSNLLKTLKKYAIEKIGTCAKLADTPRNTFLKYLRLFSLTYSYSIGGDLITEVTNRFSANFKYPVYSTKPVKIFNSSNDFVEYELALELHDKIRIAIEQKKNNEIIELGRIAKEKFINILKDTLKIIEIRDMPDFLRNYTAGHQYGLVMFESITALKRDKSLHLDAVNLINLLLNQNVFLTTKRGKWYVELVTILYHHLKDYSKAIEYLLQAQEDKNVNLVAQSALQEQASRILNMKKIPVAIKKPMENYKLENFTDLSKISSKVVYASTIASTQRGNKRVYVTRNKEYIEYSSVEEVALSYFKDEKEYEQGLHDEGKFLKSILMSCFWDVIYNEPKYENNNVSVFVNFFQTQPLDLGRDGFYERRKESIQARLSEMKTHTDIINMIHDCCNKYEGTETGNIINWNYLCKSKMGFVEGFVKCLPVKFMTAVANHLLENYRAFSSGFPDLTIWNTKHSKVFIAYLGYSGYLPSSATLSLANIRKKLQVNFVEVKGPNDTLSNKQQIWLQNIMDFGCKSTICYVKDNGGTSCRTNNTGAKRRKLSNINDSEEL